MKIIAGIILLLLVLLLAIPRCSKKEYAPEPGPDIPIPLAFSGSSTELKATEIVSTLETPIPKGKNVVWCASFLSAWKALGQDLVGEAISLDGNPVMAGLLNSAADPRPSMPAAALYIATGWNQDGIVNQIQNDLRRRFPNKQPPTFPGITPDSFIAYSYLEANIKFSLPYNQNRKPLVFTDGSGNKTEINSFGIPTEYGDTCFKLRKQSRVLFCKGETHDEVEFAIDLCSNSSPSQIVVARIPPEQTLAASLSRVEKEIAEWKEHLRMEYPNVAIGMQSIGPSDTFLVPDFHWFISHRFSELEGRAFANEKLKGQRLDVAQQDILFRLDKSGAELKSEAKAYAAAEPNDFILNRPFLVYMKKRDAQMPYFVMWVDNAELLNVWLQGVENKSVDQ
jgi:hypothetical protein